MARNNNNNRPNLSNRIRTLSSYIPQPRVNLADNDRIRERPLTPDEAFGSAWSRAREEETRVFEISRIDLERQFQQQVELQSLQSSRGVTRGRPHIIQDPTESIIDQEPSAWERHVNSNSGVWISDPGRFREGSYRGHIVYGTRGDEGRSATESYGMTFLDLDDSTNNLRVIGRDPTTEPLSQLPQDSRIQINHDTYEWSRPGINQSDLRIAMNESTQILPREELLGVSETSRTSSPASIDPSSIEDFLRQLERMSPRLPRQGFIRNPFSGVSHNLANTECDSINRADWDRIEDFIIKDTQIYMLVDKESELYNMSPSERDVYLREELDIQVTSVLKCEIGPYIFTELEKYPFLKETDLGKGMLKFNTPFGEGNVAKTILKFKGYEFN